MDRKELCVLIPAMNEEPVILETIRGIDEELNKLEIPYNILVIDDHSTDETNSIIESLMNSNSRIKIIKNEYERGVGNAIRFGLDHWIGDVVVIAMADASDSPKDITLFYNTYHQEASLCVFGSRFIEGGKVVDYPKFKLFLNRVFNVLVNIKLRKNYYDYTNAFKLYDRKLLEIMPTLESSNFSVFLELSMNSFKLQETVPIVPNSWYNRKKGKSKLNLIKNSMDYLKILYKK
jgi:dolichol-phosphate mannosyltransferase